LLEEIIRELSVFRRALRGEDKIAFDSLMNKAREHASSCTVAPVLEPMDAIFLSILVEQQKELNSLREAAAHVPSGHQVRHAQQHDNEMDQG
jgi:hypothetical protein